MKNLEELYEQILQEGKIMDWIKDHAETIVDAYQNFVAKHGSLERGISAIAGAAMIPTSAVVMAAYFNKFFQDNPEVANFPIEFLQKASHFIAQYLVDHPEYIEVLKKIAGH